MERCTGREKTEIQLKMVLNTIQSIYQLLLKQIYRPVKKFNTPKKGVFYVHWFSNTGFPILQK